MNLPPVTTPFPPSPSYARPRPQFSLLAATWLLAAHWLPTVRADDFQAWQWLTVQAFHTEEWMLFLLVDNRLADDLSDPYIQVVSPRLSAHHFEHVDLGLGYAWLNVNPLSDSGAFWQHRAEFELNPHWRSGPWSFHNRNRLELRWNDGRGQRLPRLRNRFQVRYAFGDGFLKHAYANQEFFIDLTNGVHVENRLIPAAVGFRLSDRVTLNLFYMRQSLRRPAGWEHSHIAGTFFQVR